MIPGANPNSVYARLKEALKLKDWTIVDEQIFLLEQYYWENVNEVR